MKENVRTADSFGIDIEYAPVTVVKAPVVVPLTKTVAPISGSPVLESVTLPLTCLCCNNSFEATAVPTLACKATRKEIITVSLTGRRNLCLSVLK